MRRPAAALACCLLTVAGTGLAADWSARPLRELAVHPRFSVPAVVVARDEARLAAEVAGRIAALPARLGQRLARGEVVARVDDSAYRIELQRAEAQAALVDNRIRLAESQLARSEALAARQFLSEDALRVRRSELAVLGSERDAALAAVAAARLALARCVLRAPFDGVVRERLASEGELAAPGTVLVLLAATGEAEVHASVPLDQLEALQQDEQRTLVADGRRIALALVRISPLVDRAAQSRDVVLASRTALDPGLAGELRWVTAQPYLPPEYLQARAGRLGAYVVEGGEPVFKVLPQAQTGRPAAVDWSPDTPVVDRGRLAIGLGNESR